eukprot:jgi/Mesvir1/21781/Mv04177-RA.1
MLTCTAEMAADGNATDTLPSDAALGQVVTAQANFVRVLVTAVGAPSQRSPEEEEQRRRTHFDDQPLARDGQVGVELLCVVRAVLKKIQRRVLVGDYVTVGRIDWVDQRGMVTDVLPRSNAVMDIGIANVDQLCVVFSLTRPAVTDRQLSRFLVASEATGIPVTLVFNKADLVPPEVIEEWTARVSRWGYAPAVISAGTGAGMDELARRMAGRVTVLTGPSGVGKSSIINQLRAPLLRQGVPSASDAVATAGRAGAGAEGEAHGAEGSAWLGSKGEVGRASSTCDDEVADEEAEMGEDGVTGSADSGGGMEFALAQGVVNSDMPLAVADVSERSGQGRHTTRSTTLLRLPGGGLLADTPGYSNRKTDAIEKSELPLCFPEIRARLQAASAPSEASTPGTPETQDEGDGRSARTAKCQYSDCLHRDEPGCLVRGDWERYAHYLEYLAQVEGLEDVENKMSKKTETIRYKSRGKGRQSAEPMLNARKHRRVSRKRANQSMMDHMDEEDQDARDGDDDDKEEEEEEEGERQQSEVDAKRGKGRTRVKN